MRTSTASYLCVLLVAVTSIVSAQSKPTPNINTSKEYPNVIHSPAAESTPQVFRSVLQLEIGFKSADGEEEIRYADGVVIARGGLIASVLAEPGTEFTAENILSVDILMLDGTAIAADVIAVDAAHGLALLRAGEPNLPALELSNRPIVAKRRLNWHVVYPNGQKTILYTRPVQVHKSKVSFNGVEDLCEIIDYGTSALTSVRSGSALLSLDGRVVALMGRQAHWNVSPKNVRPRTKVAHAVPASVVAALLKSANSQ